MKKPAKQMGPGGSVQTPNKSKLRTKHNAQKPTVKPTKKAWELLMTRLLMLLVTSNLYLPGMAHIVSMLMLAISSGSKRKYANAPQAGRGWYGKSQRAQRIKEI